MNTNVVAKIVILVFGIGLLAMTWASFITPPHAFESAENVPYEDLPCFMVLATTTGPGITVHKATQVPCPY